MGDKLCILLRTQVPHSIHVRVRMPLLVCKHLNYYRTTPASRTEWVSQLIGSHYVNDEKFPLVNPSIQHPIYVKAFPLREPTDVPRIKAEIIEGNILIVKITPIAKRSVEETKSAIAELVDFVKSIQGDIARLGEERIVMTPPTVKVWRGRDNLPVEAEAARATANEEI